MRSRRPWRRKGRPRSWPTSPTTRTSRPCCRRARSSSEEGHTVLLKGLNHVALLTNDATRLNDFYREVFDAEVVRDGPEPLPDREGPRLSIIKIGDWAELNVFQITGNTEA